MADEQWFPVEEFEALWKKLGLDAKLSKVVSIHIDHEGPEIAVAVKYLPSQEWLEALLAKHGIGRG